MKLHEMPESTFEEVDKKLQQARAEHFRLARKKGDLCGHPDVEGGTCKVVSPETGYWVDDTHYYCRECGVQWNYDPRVTKP